MTPAGESRDSLRASLSSLALLKRICASPRLYVYTASTLLVVTTSYFLGKEMLWDTLYYHVYAGFSALHNRFGRDYFAAGPQGYFNPYAYVPFYLLIRSSLTPLAIASILAVMQSAILWLTYELATASVPRDKPQIRVLIGVSAVIFAFANPILINEFGSSAIDVTTAEIVLAGWLALIAALRNPGLTKVVFGGLLLGAASALKPTNAVHAVAAAAIPLFVPGSFRRKFGYTSLFVAGVGVALVLDVAGAVAAAPVVPDCVVAAGRDVATAGFPCTIQFKPIARNINSTNKITVIVVNTSPVFVPKAEPPPPAPNAPIRPPPRPRCSSITNIITIPRSTSNIEKNVVIR